MAKNRADCPRCGSNFKPECKGCEHDVRAINQKHVEEDGRMSHEYALSSMPYRINQAIRYTTKTYNDSMYEEGSEW